MPYTPGRNTEGAPLFLWLAALISTVLDHLVIGRDKRAGGLQSWVPPRVRSCMDVAW